MTFPTAPAGLTEHQQHHNHHRRIGLSLQNLEEAVEANDSFLIALWEDHLEFLNHLRRMTR